MKQEQINEMSFKILESVIGLDSYSSKEELVKLLSAMCEVANNNSEYPEIIVEGYKEALNKVNMLSYEEILELKEIIAD